MKDQELVNALRLKCGGGKKMERDVIGAMRTAFEQSADRIVAAEEYALVLKKEIEKLRAQLPRWIPVTERLPEDRSDVLVVAYWHERWGVYMGWCAPERAAWSVHIGIGDRSDIAVTHWMPLPEPPEVENAEAK